MTDPGQGQVIDGHTGQGHEDLDPGHGKGQKRKGEGRPPHQVLIMLQKGTFSFNLVIALSVSSYLSDLLKISFLTLYFIHCVHSVCM